MRIKRVTLTGFRTFKRYSVDLDKFTVLVGPNNSGKSTILYAFRVLAEALRRARTRKAEVVPSVNGETVGWRIGADFLPAGAANIHHDYEEEPASLRFDVSDGNALEVHFPRDATACTLIAKHSARIRTPSEFRRHFPIEVAHLPVLGALDDDETLVEKETVLRGLGSHRASRHFRSYWYYHPESFDAFASLVAETWPGVEICRPELARLGERRLAMFVRERRVPREIFWAGFGLQVWCQLIARLSQCSQATLLVLDEPETYLHPELQRRLIALLRDIRPDIIMATHSTEVMGDVDPSDLVLVNKESRAAVRLRSIDEVQGALDAIGSLHNVTLTELSRQRKVLFTEGKVDFRLIRRFAGRVGLSMLASGHAITHVESEGFANWTRLQAAASAIQKILGTPLKLAVVFDRDYRCVEESAQIQAELEKSFQVARFLERKEIENYLLVPEAIQRAADRVAQEKRVAAPDVQALLESITESMKEETISRLCEARNNYFRSAGHSTSTIVKAVLDLVSTAWPLLHERLKIVPGKKVMASLRERLQLAGVQLSDTRIVDAMHRSELPSDMVDLVKELDQFRIS